MNNILYLYQDCFIFKGIKNSIIYDSFEKKYIHIPTEVLPSENNEFCLNKKNKSLIDFLLSNNYGYLSSSKNSRNYNYKYQYKTPKEIDSLIFEIGNSLILESISELILNSNFSNLQIRILPQEKPFDLNSLLNHINISSIRYVEYLLSYEDYICGNYSTIFLSNRTQTVYIYNSLKNTTSVANNSINLIFSTDDLTDPKKCGAINIDNFTHSSSEIAKNFNHNSCLAHKLFIDKDGNFKNCPSIPMSFGNIKINYLSEVLYDTNFKKYWNISKDSIEVCKDCEFRYICVDCRAYTENSLNHNNLDLSKPLKCGYNPYTGERNNWKFMSEKIEMINFYEIDI